MKRRQIGLITAVVVVLGGGLLVTSYIADLRPDVISLTEEQPDREAQGRTLLEASARAHGLERWQSLTTTAFEMRDEWVGFARWFNPWPADVVELTGVQRNNRFVSRIEFLEGPPAGTVWGRTESSTWWVDPGRPPQIRHDPDIEFMLPTVQYFIEAPFRLREAEVVRYVGPETFPDGTTYEVVFATWLTLGANPAYDQYVIYLDPQSHRLERLAYTVREIHPAVTGSMHFGDWREVDGVLLAHDFRVLGDVQDDPEAGWMHRMTVTDYRFDSADPESLIEREADAAPPEPGDEAPANPTPGDEAPADPTPEAPGDAAPGDEAPGDEDTGDAPAL